MITVSLKQEHLALSQTFPFALIQDNRGAIAF